MGESPSCYDDDELRAVAEAYKTHGGIRTACRAINMPRTTFRRRLKAAAEKGYLGFEPVLPGFKIASTSTTYEGSAEDGLIKSETIRQRPEGDGEAEGTPFEVPQGFVLKGGTYNVDGSGFIRQSWIRTREDGDKFLVEALREVFKDLHGVVPLIPPPAITDADLLTIYPIADQHNGLLAWGRETGESYDLQIGVDRLRSCMTDLVSQSKATRYAVILNLGDWQHTDDSSNETPAHHNKLDVDSRFKKILRAGVRLFRDCIDLALQKHEIVIIVNIPGNHDPHTSIALDTAIAAAYENNPRVQMGEIIADCYFHRFGKTLIGATHGHKLKKPQDMAIAMATRCREDWGQTDYHLFYFGHIHHETVVEVGDVRCESFQTLAANDAHHAASGYVSGKSLNAITIHRERGEIGRHRVNVPPPVSRAQTVLEEAA